jgi:5-methylcytosine-specific restriction endonuclease McrA
MPKTFGRARPSTGLRVAPQALRTSPRLRGYDAKWDRLSRKVRERAGLCQRCDFFGRVRSPKVADHKHPVMDGGDRFALENLWALCRQCHDWKASLEAHARSTGQVEMLRFWCDNPDQVPAKFREVRA